LGPHDQLFEPAQIVSIVGDQPILAGDLLPYVDQAIKEHEGKVPQYELDRQRELLMKQLLKQSIDTKLVYLDFLRTVPPDRLPMIEEKLIEQYDETQLEKAMKRAGVSSPAALDAKLRESGSSLAKQRRTFGEQLLAREMIRKNVNYDEEIAHEEMLAYYREHQKDYFVPAQSRWEQLVVRFSRFPSKAEAYRAIANTGNDVKRGIPFAVVARRHSQGFNASKGGQQDWTRKGSLRSKLLDTAIFTLPVGYLSEIIETEDSFRIVRVIQRREAGYVPFVEAQAEIKKKIRKQRIREQTAAYMQRVRQGTRVWTIFDKENTAEHTAERRDSRYQPSPR